MKKLLPLLVLVLTAAPGALAAGAGGGILVTGSYWRCRLVRGTELTRTADGKLMHVHPFEFTKRVSKMVDGKRRSVEVIAPFSTGRLWGPPPADWRKADFDDGAWGRLKGPFLIGAYKTPQFGYRSVPLLCLRGKFKMKAPSGGLKLSVAYHGGLVVYVNGKEVARRHLPKGKLEPATPAEEYPEEVYVDDKGKPLDMRRAAKAHADRLAKRVRHLKDLAIPASALRKGVNVLALELHRAPAREIMFSGRRSPGKWSRVGLASVRLSGAGATGATGRPPGFQVWTAPIYQEVGPADYGDPCDSPGRIRLCTGRNGVVSG